MKYLSHFFFGVMLFLTGNTFAQLNAEVTTTVDSTQVKIGEQINLTLQVKTDSLSMVEFAAELNSHSFVFTHQQIATMIQVCYVQSKNAKAICKPMFKLMLKWEDLEKTLKKIAAIRKT